MGGALLGLLEAVALSLDLEDLGAVHEAVDEGDGAPGHEIERPMAVVILGGLLSSTVLTLVVTPALYASLGRATDVRRREPRA